MILPVNKPKEVNSTPKRFLIWGDNFSGKTYFLSLFPNVLLINTDNNADKTSTPSVVIHKFEDFVDILVQLERGHHEYEAIGIDLIDDLKIMLQDFICRKYKVEDIGEVPYGNGYRELSQKWNQIIIRLCSLPYYIIFTSYMTTYEVDGVTVEEPSLDSKFLRITRGRCDMVIRTKSINNKYIRLCTDKRLNYKESDVMDQRILTILKTVQGAFPLTKEQPVSNITKKGEDNNG